MQKKKYRKVRTLKDSLENIIEYVTYRQEDRGCSTFSILFDYLAGGKKRLPLHTGAFFMFIYTLSFFLTSTAFADTNANIYSFKMSHDIRLNIFTPEAQYGIFISMCIL